MLLRWKQQDLASASGASLQTIKRLETRPGPLALQPLTLAAIEAAFDKVGVEFISANGGGPGVRLKRKPRAARSAAARR